MLASRKLLLQLTLPLWASRRLQPGIVDRKNMRPRRHLGSSSTMQSVKEFSILYGNEVTLYCLRRPGWAHGTVGHCAANPGANSQVKYEPKYQVLLSGVEQPSYNWDMIRSIAAPV